MDLKSGLLRTLDKVLWTDLPGLSARFAWGRRCPPRGSTLGPAAYMSLTIKGYQKHQLFTQELLFTGSCGITLLVCVEIDCTLVNRIWQPGWNMVCILVYPVVYRPRVGICKTIAVTMRLEGEGTESWGGIGMWVEMKGRFVVPNRIQIYHIGTKVCKSLRYDICWKFEA